MNPFMQLFVTEARTWLGTKFQHQGRLKGVGVDCAGVVIMTARACHVAAEDVEGYAESPDADMFLNHVKTYMNEIQFEEIMPGDCLVFAFANEPQHIAIVTEIDPDIIILHAFSIARKVVENGLDDTWKRRLRGCFRFKEYC